MNTIYPKHRRRRRFSNAERQQIQAEALQRATENLSWANYPAIFQGFIAKGIPESEILPRENVFTYNAWKAKGRYVRKGEHGVKITSWVPTYQTDEETGEKKETGRRPVYATVFHVSQTEALD